MWRTRDITMATWKKVKLLSATSALVCFETLVGYLDSMPGHGSARRRGRILSDGQG
tara:strand:+ start:196 stop:363 length:168 start_codon:yes stop_codon:yes gene_type:complete